jgi:hypothetical protein
MKTSLQMLCSLTAFVAVTLTPSLSAQDHGHLRIAAYSTTQNAKLYWYNGADFASSNSYIKTFVYTNSGKYAGYFQDNITLTVQAATSDYGGPEANPPAFGSYIRARILSVAGPAGGSFSFWEAGTTAPTFSVPVGAIGGTNTYNVTQTDGAPGADPFGHIHGRRLTATVPGIYLVTFQAFDTCTNGLGGGPIHTPSDPISVYIQAGVNFHSIQPGPTLTTVRFGAQSGKTWQLESSDALSPQPSWQPVGLPVSGDDYLHNIIDPRLHSGSRFYRVRELTQP